MRLPDWEARLAEYLGERRTRAFEWGQHDCALFAAGAINALTGVDPGDAYRGKYHDAIGAAQALREIGQGTLIRTFNQLARPCPRAMAGRGDLAMVGKGLAGSIGVVIGGDAVFVSDHGLERIGRSQWVRCWAV